MITWAQLLTIARLLHVNADSLRTDLGSPDSVSFSRRGNPSPSWRLLTAQRALARALLHNN